MKYLKIVALSLLGVASALAQNASLTANTTTLAASGGSLVLTASTTYTGELGALGWAIDLPENWTLESVAGPQVPEITPAAGTAGKLEFAYTSVPAERAEFVVVVRYPAGATTATATPTVLVRGGGKLTTLKPAALELRAADSGAARRSRN